MGEAKPTKGPWVVEIDSDVDAEWANQWPIIKTADGDTIICGTEGFYSTLEQDIANANLCADAGTVFHTTGLTPTQLVEQRDGLAGLLGEIYEMVRQGALPNDGDEWFELTSAALSKARPNTAEGEAIP